MVTPYSIVLVPGIGGSRLSSNVFGFRRTVWFEPSLIGSLIPQSLALASDGQSPYPVVGLSLFADAPVNLGVYEPFMSVMGSAGLPVAFFPYDWRLKPDNVASLLATFLQETPLTNPFHVVCHSMGGLVAQFAYPLYVAAGNNPKWADTTYIATPQGGSHWATMCLNGLFGVGSLWNALATIWNISSWVNPLLSFSFSALASLVGLVIGSWPSTYALLPNAQGVWQGLDPLAGLALQMSTYAGGPGGVQQQWLTYASTFQALLIAMYKQPRPTEMVCVGGSTPTPRAFTAGGNYQTLSGYGTTSAGDGTVAIERSLFLQNPFATFEGSTHQGLMDSATLQGQLAAWIQHGFPLPNVGADFNDEPPFKGPALNPFPPQNSTIVSTYADQFANKFLDP